MGGNNYYQDGSSSSTQYTDDAITAVTDDLSAIHQSSSAAGPLGIDPLHFTQFAFLCLMAWLTYLFIPRGLRFRYFGSFPKRYAWSPRSKRRRIQQRNGTISYNNASRGATTGTDTESLISFAETSTTFTNHTNNNNHNQESSVNHQMDHAMQVPEDEIVDFTSTPVQQTASSGSSSMNNMMNNNMNNNKPPLSVNTSSSQIGQMYNNNNNNPTPNNNSSTTPFSSGASTFNDEIAISTTMQQLRDAGVQIIAHGSKGKPKTVRLLLTENAITWRTESTRQSRNNSKKHKIGKSHQVPLSHIMYVDVGKQTTALRRVENAALADTVCLSLLTKDGSLDLEASSSQERDALVNCFSLVLDEVHAQNWRDVYRAPSSDLPSSFDEYDVGGSGGVPGAGVQRMEV